ncbi:MAG: YaiO family outer membrane beta-barrel protein [candidate division Zixibacteria bacterium]|nr:YaiO family outer membrane beta-barrel protein [candidate division Zixibacteria bacterium]
MKYFTSIILITLILVLSAPGSSNAQFIHKNRIETQFIYEHITPTDLFDPWKSFYIKYYRFQKPGLNFSVQAGVIHRYRQTDYIGIATVNKDWQDWFYTYTAVATGSETDYLPKFRLDHEFNFKVEPTRRFVATVGVTYFKYHSDNEDIILSIGGTFYLPRWNFAYKFYRNRSNPGGVISYTHLVSVGYGEEYKQWTYLTLSFGDQAYLAIVVAPSQEVRQDVFRASLSHRRWFDNSILIFPKWGIYGDISYYTIDDGYDVYGFSAGLFADF